MNLNFISTTLLLTVLKQSKTERVSTWDSCGCYWGPWLGWSQCTETCGGGNRKRERWVYWKTDIPPCGDFYGCATPGSGWMRETCNPNCFNGGTFSSYPYDGWYGGYCSCPIGTRGSCCEQIVDCGTPSTITNGDVVFSTTMYGSKVTYTCKEDYNMTEPAAAVRSCTDNGYWSGSLPVCLYAESCKSSPCNNGATCENLLAGFRCHCAPGWAGSTCEIDIQPPVMTGCSTDQLVYSSVQPRHNSWTAPVFTDPHGFNISVTSNYEESEYEFPWGEFVVQYHAVKPSNGMTTECSFTRAVKPFPCQALAVPANSVVACNGWQTDYYNICRVSCLHGYALPADVSPDTLYLCGATGSWMPTNAFEKCIPTDFKKNPAPKIQTYSGCQDTDDVTNITSAYIEHISTSSFNYLCHQYSTECSYENVIVRC